MKTLSVDFNIEIQLNGLMDIPEELAPIIKDWFDNISGNPSSAELEELTNNDDERLARIGGFIESLKEPPFGNSMADWAIDNMDLTINEKKNSTVNQTEQNENHINNNPHSTRP